MDARAITSALGGKWQRGNYGLCRCPVHSDRTPSLKVSDSDTKSDGVDLYCFAGCDWKTIKDELRYQGILPEFSAGEVRVDLPRGIKLELETAVSKPENDTYDRALKIWKATTPLSGTLGLRYLNEVRGIDISLDLSHALRFHEYSTAVVALMTDPVSGEPVGVHRTFIKDDGSKRERKMLGRAGVVRLSPDEDVTIGLGITEGIEDGLAVLASGWSPIWAALSCGGVERFPVLSGIEALTIFHDRDEAGIRAAEICAERGTAAGKEVFL